MSLISVIVPVYNAEKYLRACIDSIVKQSYRNLEILLVDDGSTDKSPGICDFYAQSDSRIRVIHKKNHGLSAARETGLICAEGEWVSFVDNDDLLHPRFFEILLHFITDEIDIVSGGRIDLNDSEIETFKWPDEWKDKVYHTTGEEACRQMSTVEKRGIVLPFWGKIFRKSLLRELKFERNKELCPTIFLEDILMTPFYLYQARKIVGIGVPLYIHREVPTSISRSGKLGNFYYEQIDSGEIVLHFFKEKGFGSMYREQLKVYFNTLLRTWYLLDFTEIETIQKAAYKKKIEKKFKQYFPQYLAKGKAGGLEKISSVIFFLNRFLWKKVCGDVYWRNVKRGNRNG